MEVSVSSQKRFYPERRSAHQPAGIGEENDSREKSRCKKKINKNRELSLYQVRGSEVHRNEKKRMSHASNPRILKRDDWPCRFFS